MDADLSQGPMRAVSLRDHRATGDHVPDVDCRLVPLYYRTWRRSTDHGLAEKTEAGDLQGAWFQRPDGPLKPASAAAPTGKRPIGSWWLAAPMLVARNDPYARAEFPYQLLPIRQRKLKEGLLVADDRYAPAELLRPFDPPKPPGNLTDEWDRQVRCVLGRDVPAGTPGLVVSGSEETSQEGLFFPATGDLVAHHLPPGPPRFSTRCYDIQTPPSVGALHETLWAGIHSNWRVKYLLGADDGSGSVDVDAPTPTGLCYNHDASGDGSDGYGLVVANVFSPSPPGKPP